jgi:FtsP/CotA-like multicopper oxidase with cupredoxin domain
MANANGEREYNKLDVATTPLIVPPAGRVEFVVHAPPAGDTLYLQSGEVDPGCAGNRYPPRRLLRITSQGTPVDPGAANDRDLLGSSTQLQKYLATLRTSPTVSRTFVLSEYSRDFTYGITKWLSGPPTENDFNPAQVDFYLTQVASSDGQAQPSHISLVPFSPHLVNPKVVVHLHGQPSVTEDWLVENATLEIHAFHTHQVHFRDVTVDSDDPFQQPLLDVVTVPAAQQIGDIATGYPGAPGWVKLRLTFTTADIGEFVFHCHILEHEDNGMMLKIQVVAD